MDTKLIEGKFGHGAIKINPVRRRMNKLLRPKAKGFSFDWSKGYDVRDDIGSITIKNQGDNYSCGGQAGSYFLEIQRRLQNKKEGSLSAKSIYSQISYPGGGTTVNSLMTQIATEGANMESQVPSYYITGAPLSEAMMIEKSWKTDRLSDDALSRAGYTPYDIGEDMDEVASAIKNYGAVIWEVRGKNNGTWLSRSPQVPLKTNQNAYFYHFMCLIGAKIINGRKTIIALQSMGEAVGDKGIQYFTEDWFTSRNVIDCFTFIYDTRLVPDPSNKSIWAEIHRWFIRKWQIAGMMKL